MKYICSLRDTSAANLCLRFFRIFKSSFSHYATHEPHHEKTAFFAYAKTKTQISFAVTAKLISAFVFATGIVQSLYFLNTKFQASSHLVWLYSLVSDGPGRESRRPVFSQRGSYYVSYNNNDVLICHSF